MSVVESDRSCLYASCPYVRVYSVVSGIASLCIDHMWRKTRLKRIIPFIINSYILFISLRSQHICTFTSRSSSNSNQSQYQAAAAAYYKMRWSITSNHLYFHINLTLALAPTCHLFVRIHICEGMTSEYNQNVCKKDMREGKLRGCCSQENK